jgi:hypothetical protein
VTVTMTVRYLARRVVMRQAYRYRYEFTCSEEAVERGLQYHILLLSMISRPFMPLYSILLVSLTGI